MIFGRATERGRVLARLAIDFVHGEIDADLFEARFLAGWQAAPGRRFGQYDEVLSHIFISVDAYCGDPELRGPDDTDAEGMRGEVASFLRAAGLL
jgi:hypothetical protein